MQTSQFIAGLIGPLLLTVTAGLLFLRKDFEATVDDAVTNRGLIFFAGIILLVAGLAIVRTHNIWVWDWRVLVTIFGWLSIVGGIARILFAGQVAGLREALGRNEMGKTLGALGAGLIGVVLTVKGYGLFGL